MTSETFEIGLDEAGYGPLLGPLAIGAVRVDGPLLSLKEASRRRRRGAPRILDSKLLYRGGEGLDELERTALSAWAVAKGRLPQTVAEYWEDGVAGGEAHPWYGNLADALPRWNTRTAIEDAAACLGSELHRQGATLTRATAHCHLEGTLNDRMAALSNKADVHLDHIGRALLSVLETTARPGRVNCDRLGGRQDYGPFLSMLFPFVPMTTEREEPVESRYVVGSACRIEVRFMVNGERRSKEVALASCLAKYGRELMMDCFNRTFTWAYEGLKPTAGYYKDARRFLRELEAAAGADAGWKSRLSRLR
jgi:hypothetical protein